MAKIIAIALLAALNVGAIVGLSVALHYSIEKVELQQMYQRDMESVYSRAYYNLLDGANDIDVTMSKITVASTPEKQQSLLYELWSAATLTEDNLEEFNSSDEGVRTATRFVNQLGDYSLYLAKKIGDGQTLSSKDKETFVALKPMASTLKTSLENIQTDLDDGKLFLDDNGVLTTFNSAFSSFTEPSLDYPEMIYDGPFSDAIETKQAKSLEVLPEISGEKGTELLSAYFDGVSNIDYLGRFEGRIPTHNYSFNVENKQAYAQLSVKGGKLINFSLSVADGKEADHQQALSTALAFATKLGYENLEVVWSQSANGSHLVNLAPVENGIILYPDLVKVKVTNGVVSGFDSAHHAYNHTARSLSTPTVDVNTAKNMIVLDEVGEGRLCLIPQDETKETLCYEFECQQNGTYFVYIDAMTGKEIEILYVIDTDLGTQTI